MNVFFSGGDGDNRQQVEELQAILLEKEDEIVRIKRSSDTYRKRFEEAQYDLSAKSEQIEVSSEQSSHKCQLFVLRNWRKICEKRAKKRRNFRKTRKS